MGSITCADRAASFTEAHQAKKEGSKHFEPIQEHLEGRGTIVVTVMYKKRGEN